MPDPIGTTWQVATDEDFTDIVYDQSGDFSLSRAFADGELPYGVHLYARARFEINSSQSTDWSNPVRFHVHDPDADTGIIGVACDPTRYYSVAWRWIHASGSRCTKFDWTKHPTYTNIKMVEFDTERAPVTMTAFPLFYIKTMASGPVGTDSEGYKCWWISPTPADGFRPHPAFKRTTEKDSEDKYIISDWCYIGTYAGHTETIGDVSCIGSSLDKTIYASGRSFLLPLITNRNDETSGNTGYRSFDIYDLSLIKLLSLIAYASPNTISTWLADTGFVANNTPTVTGENNARLIFKGSASDPQVFIDDICSSIPTNVDLHGITETTNLVYLISPMDLTTELIFTESDASRYTLSEDFNASGTQDLSFAKYDNVLDCPITIGDDTHDLLEFFIPGPSAYDYGNTSVITTAFFAYCRVTALGSHLYPYSSGFMNGGGLSNGIFHMIYWPTSYVNSRTTCARIAKN